MSTSRHPRAEAEQDEKERLLEALIEEVDSMMDKADEHARNASGEYSMLKATGRATAYQRVQKQLEERKSALEQARMRASTPNYDEETSISAARLGKTLLNMDDTRFWWPEREAVIRVGAYSKERVKQGRRRGTELYTHVTFAVIDYARREGDTVVIDNRHRLMGVEELPAAEALELVRDECSLLKRASPVEEAADPRTTGPRRKLYHIASDATK